MMNDIDIMPNKLFVYGTLCPGRPNEHILKNIGGTWQQGSVRGVLHNEGWGATMGYPALILDENGERVQGYVFSSDKLSAHWAGLDEFEGEAYERVLTTVELQDKTTLEAFIYVLRIK